MEIRLKVAAPWSLSHYIPLGGFRPLYRALFDHAPPHIKLSAWDNVRLHRHFANNPTDREVVSGLTHSHERDNDAMETGTAVASYASQLYPPDRVLTEALDGEIEFHHAAPFPSLTRPFILHCESLGPSFFLNTPQVQAPSARHDELRKHYRRLLKNPLCQGIYSHIPETLHGISNFFSDPAIDEKLFNSKIGLSRLTVDRDLSRPRRPIDRPRFLFINPAHQGPAGFFDRGGHIALRFWKEFQNAGRQGMLILCCGRPDNDQLKKYGVDPAFMQSEIGRSIIWAEANLADHEINALIADAHFFLLPSASLHSASILRSMTLGAIPVVTDIAGTSVYVTDGETAIVLEGLRNETRHRDLDAGALLDYDEGMPNVAGAMVTQLVQRVLALLDSTNAYHAMSERTSERARTRFSGQTFASEFWEAVAERAQRAGAPAKRSSDIVRLSHSLRACTLNSKTWSRVFEGSPQPMPLVDTGASKIFELGGAVVHLPRDEPTDLTHWSVFARYFDTNAPKTSFANTLVELAPYLFGADNHGRGLTGNLRSWASNALIRFPNTHSLASQVNHWMRRTRTTANLWMRHRQFRRGKIGDDQDLVLVLENIYGFNIVRYFHKFYAIPHEEGAFKASKVDGKQYSESFCAYSLNRIVGKVERVKRRDTASHE